MKLRHLEVLHAILQTGSITQAARLLHVSQPSISTTLQHCEAQLGVQLFVRAGGRLKPVGVVKQRPVHQHRAFAIGPQAVRYTQRARRIA